MLSEGTLLNVSHNNYTHFAYTYQILPTTPQCYFQYISNRNVQLDNDHGNYSVIFDKNNEKYTQNAYNNLPIVHCSWLPQSAYNTTMPLIVNKQYIQFINASGTFNMLPQSARQKTLCYCDTTDHDSYGNCYKE